MFVYVLIFIGLCFFFKTILDVIDSFKSPNYHKKLKAYSCAIIELSNRLEKVAEKIPKGTNLVEDYAPLVSLTGALLLHSIPSRKEFKDKSPVELFYGYFGEYIEQIRKYDGWSDKPLDKSN